VAKNPRMGREATFCREVLIKSVIQAIPTYTMGYFKIPMGLCNEIEAMINFFWWGQRGDRRKIH